MTLLQELYGIINEQIDGLPAQTNYVPLPATANDVKKKKAKRKQFPTTDTAQNSLINYLWLNQNSDAT